MSLERGGRSFRLPMLGASEIGLPHLRKWDWLDWFVVVGFLVTLAHPTFASVYGSQGSLIVGAVALVLLLPALRTIMVAPFVALLVASALVAIVDGSPRPIAMAIAAYAVFYATVRRPHLMSNVYIFALSVAFLWGQIQFLSPPESIVNSHATVISPHLYYLRPTTFFPSQIYYSQFLLLLVAAFAATGEKRWWVMILWGAAAASAGSTAGIACTFLALGLWSQRGWLMPLAFVATTAVHAVFFWDWWYYNYEWSGVASSVFSERLTMVDPTPDGTGVGDVGTPPDTLGGILQLTAVGGVLFAVSALLVGGGELGRLLRLAVGVLALIVATGIQPIIGSLYFSFYLGTLAALAWLLLSEIHPGLREQVASQSKPGAV